MSKALARQAPFRLSDLGVFGFDRHEAVILAALVTEDPLLLVGRSGTGKTFLLNTLSEALGLEHRHYNASLIAFDDLVGFPYPDEARASVSYLETPATVWGAESVLIDEISRCKPEHQNRLFSLVHERRLQGLSLSKLRYRWAAMNPCSADQDGAENYAGSEPLDPALADRFGLIVPAADWCDLSADQQRAIVAPASEGQVTPINAALQESLAGWRKLFLERSGASAESITTYVTTAVNALSGAGVRVSPRRARYLARSLVAANIVAGGEKQKVFRAILDCSLPQATWGQAVAAEIVAAAHRTAWDASRRSPDAWVHAFLAEPELPRKLELLLENCKDPDTGSQAVAQLLAQEPPARSAAFAFAVYPSALQRALPIGAEGVNDLGRIAVPLLEVDTHVSLHETIVIDARHPALSEISRLTSKLKGGRAARAQQFLRAAFIRRIELLPSSEYLERQLNGLVELLRSRGLAGDAA